MGIKQHVPWERLPGLDSQVEPNQHLWILLGVFRVNPAVIGSGEVHLDSENLLTIEGPGCFLCEQTYTPATAALPCPGDPSGR